jgi:CheY-like chemotaxis protein
MSNKLLLADDSITIRKVVGIIFANEDYELSVVDNGGEALRKAREISPDIILADVVMPDKTGYDVCTEIRNDPDLSHVPLLLLAGAFDPFDEEKAKQCGADDFITKPFESQQLLEKVKKLIELGKERKTAQKVHEPEPVTPELPPASFTAPPPTASITEAMGVAPLQFGAVDKESAFLIEDLSEEEEIIEALPEDDLWGAFELEEVEDVEDGEFETLLEEEAIEPFGKFEAAEEPLDHPVIAPEKPAAPPEETGTVWKPSEETFTLGDEIQTGELGIVSGEKPADIPVERVDTVTEPDMGGIFVLGAEAEEKKLDLSYLGEQPPVAKPAVQEVDLSYLGEQPPVAKPTVQEVDLSYLGEQPPVAKPAVQEVELQFASEEEYVPVIPPIEPVVPPIQPAAPVALQPSVQGEITLSEEQLASIVAKISRDILEKIAWEVVPDLAEMIIREEIRKIKEGIR